MNLVFYALWVSARAAYAAACDYGLTVSYLMQYIFACSFVSAAYRFMLLVRRYC